MKIICRNCRKQLTNEKECPNCGTPSVDADGNVMTSKGLQPKPVAEKKGKKKGKKKS